MPGWGVSDQNSLQNSFFCYLGITMRFRRRKWSSFPSPSLRLGIQSFLSLTLVATQDWWAQPILFFFFFVNFSLSVSRRDGFVPRKFVWKCMQIRLTPNWWHIILLHWLNSKLNLLPLLVKCNPFRISPKQLICCYH